MSHPPANWYPDPSNPHQWRYWTGTEWTDNVAPRDIPAEPAAEPQLERQPEPVPEPVAQPVVTPEATPTPATTTVAAAATSVATATAPASEGFLSSRRNQLIAAGAAVAVVGIAAIAFMMHGSDVPQSATAPPVSGQPANGSSTNPSAAGNSAVVSQVVVPVLIRVGKPNTNTLTITAPGAGAGSSPTLTITTPYNTAKPLDLGQVTLDAAAKAYRAKMPLNGFTIADTRDPSSPYTVSAIATDFKLAGVASPTADETISPEDIGLTSIHLVKTDASPRTFIGAQTSDAAIANTNLVGYENQAGEHLASGDKSDFGLGGREHTVFHASTGKGTSEIAGIVSVAAPSNVKDGIYIGAITFTIVGK